MYGYNSTANGHNSNNGSGNRQRLIDFGFDYYGDWDDWQEPEEIFLTEAERRAEYLEYLEDRWCVGQELASFEPLRRREPRKRGDVVPVKRDPQRNREVTCRAGRDADGNKQTITIETTGKIRRQRQVRRDRKSKQRARDEYLRRLEADAQLTPDDWGRYDVLTLEDDLLELLTDLTERLPDYDFIVLVF